VPRARAYGTTQRPTMRAIGAHAVEALTKAIADGDNESP
jgi:hypothetical protein